MENMENLEIQKDNTKKRILLGSLIIVVSIVIIGISLSYAYFLNEVQEINPDNQGTNITSGELTMNLTSEKYITANGASLINDADIVTKGDYTSFSVTLPSDADASSASYSLYLTELTISDNFKSKYIYYQRNN